MSSYDEQIVKWATKRYCIEQGRVTSVKMTNEYNEGYACCGGTDPNCYCSFAESATMNLKVEVFQNSTRLEVDRIDMMYGDINKIIQEIFEA